MVEDLLGTFLHESRAWGNPLRDFMCLALTGDQASVMEAPWVRLDPGSSPALEAWYYALVARGTPPAPAPVEPAQPGTPVPPEGSEGMGTALAALTERLLAGTSEKQGSKTYEKFELDAILKTGPFDASYTVDDLPIFFRQLKDYRRKKLSFRPFMEAYIERSYPSNAIRYTYLITPKFLSDMASLNFSGGDQTLAWDQRNAGFSVFALAPAGDYVSPAARRGRMLAFEETAGQHRPADREAMDALSAGQEVLPTTRDQLYRWIDHFRIMLEMIFGPDCGLLGPIDRVLRVLIRPLHFASFVEGDFKNLLWGIHRATRGFFLDGNTRWLDRLVTDLEDTAGRPPPELLLGRTALPPPPRGRVAVGRVGPWRAASSYPPAHRPSRQRAPGRKV
jgi:hypothetical protein